jgi:hypothetical protein
MVLSENESPEVGLNKNPLSLTAMFFFIFIAEILYYKSISNEKMKCYTFLGKMYENLGLKTGWYTCNQYYKNLIQNNIIKNFKEFLLKEPAWVVCLFYILILFYRWIS